MISTTKQSGVVSRSEIGLVGHQRHGLLESCFRAPHLAGTPIPLLVAERHHFLAEEAVSVDGVDIEIENGGRMEINLGSEVLDVLPVFGEVDLLRSVGRELTDERFQAGEKE